MGTLWFTVSGRQAYPTLQKSPHPKAPSTETKMIKRSMYGRANFNIRLQTCPAPIMIENVCWVVGLQRTPAATPSAPTG
jgi:hypothetical protein